MKLAESLLLHRKIYKKYLKTNKNPKLKYETMHLPNSNFDAIKHQKGSIGPWDFRHLWGLLETKASAGLRGGGVFMEGPMSPGPECLPQNWGPRGSVLDIMVGLHG